MGWPLQIISHCKKRSNRKRKKEKGRKEVKYCSELWGHICNGLNYCTGERGNGQSRKSVSFATPMISTITAPIKKSRRQLRILPDFLLTYPTEWQCRLVHTDCVKLQFKTNRSRFWPAAADPITYCLWHFILEQTSGGCNSGGRAFSVDTKATGSMQTYKHTCTCAHTSRDMSIWPIVAADLKSKWNLVIYGGLA